MRAMILAAGRGERMRPLTDTTPKPLLKVGGRPLIVWHLLNLAQAGITNIVINHAWLGEQIEATLGDGRDFGVRISYSPEATALETAGGIVNALELLGSEPFLVINGDIWSSWHPQQAHAALDQMTRANALAWLLMVPNPEHHPAGDFALTSTGVLIHETTALPKLTFSGIGLYHPKLFAQCTAGTAAKLAPLLRSAMDCQQVIGEQFEGSWTDVGTPERLSELDRHLISSASL